MFNGRYFVDKNPKGTIVHYSSFRSIDVAGLRKQYEAAEEHAACRSDQDLAAEAWRRQGAAGEVLHAVGELRAMPPRSIADLNAQGYWLAPLGNNSHPYKTRRLEGAAARRLLADLRRRRDRYLAVPDPKLMGISVEAYVRNMGVLIRALDRRSSDAKRAAVALAIAAWIAAAAAQPPAAVEWRLDNLAARWPVVPVEIDRRAGGRRDRHRAGDRSSTAPATACSSIAIRSKDCRSSRSKSCSRLMLTVRSSSGSCTSQESAGENRALVELRLNDGRWALDSYLRHGDAQLTLLDQSKTHPRRRLARGDDDVRRHDDDALRRWRRAGQWRGRVSRAWRAAARRSAFGRIACRGSRAASTPCASPRRRWRLAVPEGARRG